MQGKSSYDAQEKLEYLRGSLMKEKKPTNLLGVNYTYKAEGKINEYWFK